MASLRFLILLLCVSTLAASTEPGAEDASWPATLAGAGAGEGSLSHVLLHAAAGCASAALQEVDCGVGAAAGAAGAIYAGQQEAPLRSAFASDEAYDAAYKQWRTDVMAGASAVGTATGVLLSGGDKHTATVASNLTTSSVQNNYLDHAQIESLRSDLAACAMEDTDCQDTVYETYRRISAENRAEMEACETAACWEHHAARMREAQDAKLALYEDATDPTRDTFDGTLGRASSFVYDEQSASGFGLLVQPEAVTLLDSWGQENCDGVIDTACRSAFAQDSTNQTAMAALEMGVDLLPVVGDIKGIIECGAETSAGACLGAAVAIVPALGDGAKVVIRRALDGEVDEVVARLNDAGDLEMLDEVPGSIGMPHPGIDDAPDGGQGIYAGQGDDAWNDQLDQLEEGVSAANGADETTILYRGVSAEEYNDIMATGAFRPNPDGGSLDGKQFGFDEDEIYNLTNDFPETSGIVKVEVPTNILNDIGDFTPVDRHILKSGSVTIQPDQLDTFNSCIIGICDALD